MWIVTILLFEDEQGQPGQVQEMWGQDTGQDLLIFLYEERDLLNGTYEAVSVDVKTQQAFYQVLLFNTLRIVLPNNYCLWCFNDVLYKELDKRRLVEELPFILLARTKTTLLWWGNQITCSKRIRII